MTENKNFNIRIVTSVFISEENNNLIEKLPLQIFEFGLEASDPDQAKKFVLSLLKERIPDKP